MEGFVQVESVSPVEFEKLNMTIVEVDKEKKYTLTKDSLSFPWDTLKITSIAVNIAKCRVGNKLKFKVFSRGGHLLCQHTSEKVVKRIFAKVKE